MKIVHTLQLGSVIVGTHERSELASIPPRTADIVPSGGKAVPGRT
jgi:hypothetical protein